MIRRKRLIKRRPGGARQIAIPMMMDQGATMRQMREATGYRNLWAARVRDWVAQAKRNGEIGADMVLLASDTPAGKLFSLRRNPVRIGRVRSKMPDTAAMRDYRYIAVFNNKVFR